MDAFKITLFLFVAAFVVYTEGGQYDGKVLRIAPNSTQEVNDLKSLETDYGLEIDFWQAPSDVGRNVDIYVHQQNLTAVLQLLNKFGISYKIMINDVQDVVDKENPQLSRQRRSLSFHYDRYNRLNAIYAEMSNLASTYSHLATLFSTGKSYEGREQLAIRIGSPSSSLKKTFFINCGTHAKEWITHATCIYMIKEMLSKYQTDSSVKLMVDKMDWVIMPCLNPDGYEFSHTDKSTRMWSRTRNINSAHVGADPHRNWNYKWGAVGTSPINLRVGTRTIVSDTFPGTRPFSEVETYNVAKYLFKNRKDLIGYMDIHAFGLKWLTPWGYKKADPNDNGEQVEVGNIAKRALRNAGWGTQYQVGPSSDIIHPINGTAGDWAYGFLGTKYSYTLQIRDDGTEGLKLSEKQIIPTGTETLAALKAMAGAMTL